MRFRILGSSSAGNSALLCTPRCKVLIDAGFTGKRMEALLEQAGVAAAEVEAIFITHEHSDHISGLRGLTRKHPDIKLFANAQTSRAIQDRMPRQLNWQIFENGLTFAYADLEVSPFSIPHDAYDPVGYLFRSGTEGCTRQPRRSVCWLTDLGYVTAQARQHAANCDLLVIEANHDPDMLERCETRSWSTKQRIRGRHGHLSNQAAYELLAGTESPPWQHVCLAHISAECNHLDIVRKQFEPLRNGARNLDIHIFDPCACAPGAEFDLWAGLADAAIVADATDAGATNASATNAAAGSSAEASIDSIRAEGISAGNISAESGSTGNGGEGEISVAVTVETTVKISAVIAATIPAAATAPIAGANQGVNQSEFCFG